MFILLLLIFLYLLGNYYIYHKVSTILWDQPLLKVITGIFIATLAIIPEIAHFLLPYGSRPLVRGVLYISFLWVGFVVLYLPVSVLFDLFVIIFKIKGTLPPIWGVLIPAIMAIGLCIYGYNEANTLRVKNITIKTEKIPSQIEKITIVQISDLHIGICSRREYILDMIEKINAINPDIIISSGDLVDGFVPHINHYAEDLKRLRARWGKYAVLGNHEYYSGLSNAIEFIKEAGFTLLNAHTVTLNNTLNIVGMPDGEDLLHNKGKKIEEAQLLNKLPSNLFTLVVKHRPEVTKETIGKFDLQISGHTHGGQIFPISLITPFMFEHNAGFKDLRGGSLLYVSRGTGTAGPLIRVFSPPEITVFNIVSDKGDSSTNQ